jgi:hypothetical protein
MKAQWNWRVAAMFLGVFLVAAAGWMVVPSIAEAASCEGAPAPCAEDPALDNCVQCHSMTIAGGNRNGTDRMITVSAASNRHILGPPLASWLSTVEGMIAKGGGGTAATIAAYLNTNYNSNCSPIIFPNPPAPTPCRGPILSTPTFSDVQSDQATMSWVTSGSGYGDLAATSCVLYGTSLTSLTGDTCNPSDPSYDSNSGNLVTNHAVTVTGLTSLTQYYFVHRSTAGADTATYAGASTITTFPGGGGTPGGGLGTIVSLAVGDYNNDLNLDLGVGISSKNHVIAYLGNGTGGFTAGQTLANVGTTPSAITSGGVEGDFDEDGNDDLAVANFGAESTNVAVFLGTSPSGWETTAVSNIPLDDPPTGIVTGDFNEDGILDLVVATVEADGSLGHVMLFTGENDGAGHGTGNFTGPLTTFNVQISTVVAPTITSIVPSEVDCLGLPADITINGSLLLNSATVTLDGVLSLPVISGSPDNTSLVVRVPVGAPSGTHSVVVALGSLPTASGTLVITPRNLTLSGISPASKTYGIDASGQVTIVGTNFTLGARVTIGPLTGITVAGTIATATTPFVFVNSSTLRVYVSNTAMPAGVYEVTVENTDTCGGSDTLVNGYTVIAPQPVVSSLSSPDVTYGVTASSSVTISGSHFLSGAVISVGGLTGATVPGTTASAATPYVFVSSTTLRFWWPNTSIPPASYSVDVTNPSAAGGLTGSLLDGFTVNSPEPTITSVSPSSETYGVSPSASVTIFGSNFLLGATITVGSLTGTTVAGTTASAATPFVRASSSQVKFYWSNTSLTPGEYDVQVTNPAASGGLSGTLPAGFEVLGAQPSITSVSPTPVTYGITASSSISIFGSNFVLGATITVGSLSGPTVASTGAATAAMPFVFVNNSQLRFYWPNTSLSPAAYSVQVSNPPASGNLSATLAGAFTVSAPQPTITNLSPDSKTYGVSASSQITVFGSNFIVGAQVTIGSLSGTTVAGSSATATVPFVHASAGQIKFWWPNTSLAPGLYAIQVTNPASAGAESGTLAAAFTVVPPQPTVTSASPTPLAYAVDVSRSVTVFGTNFINGATISVGSLSGATVAGSIATATVPYVYVSSSQLKFWWPNTALTPGSYAITVSNPAAAGGLSETLAGGFVVTAPAPSVTSVTPTPVDFGSTSRSILVSGANFVVGGTITVGSLSGTTVTGSVATATVPYVWVNSSNLRFWWPSTSLPVGPYDVQVANPAVAGGLSTTSAGAFVVQ